jgi:hypothetical protein
VFGDEFMEKIRFFRKEEKDREKEEGEVSLERREKIGEWQRKRAERLKEILFSRTADIAGNYIPGIDVVKMTIEGAVGRTLSKRELSPVERTLFILSSAAIFRFLFDRRFAFAGKRFSNVRCLNGA